MCYTISAPNRKEGVFTDFYGLQKLTLLDYPGRMACTVFTGGCNLRCPFCHNAALITDLPAPSVTGDEVLTFLSKRKGILDGICVTGGEPLLQKEMKDFLISVKQMGFAVKLDTNGFYPEALRELAQEGLLDYVAMDVKNCPEKYAETVGVPDPDLASVRESVSFLLQGTVPYEFRTTVVRELHDVQDIEAIGQWIEGASHYALQAFVDSGALLCGGLSAWDRETMEQMAAVARRFVPNTELRGI